LLPNPSNPPSSVKRKSFSEGRGPRWHGAHNAANVGSSTLSRHSGNPYNLNSQNTTNNQDSSPLKDKSLEVLKTMRTLVVSAENDGEEIIASKVKEFLKTVNELLSMGLAGCSGDWIHLFLDDQHALNEAVHGLAIAAVENKFKGGGGAKNENEKLVTNVTTGIKNFLVSSDLFLEK